MTDSMAMAGSPAQWAFLVVVVVLVFAPRLLPALARLFAMLFAREASRRLGVPVAQPRPMKPAPKPVEERVEVLPPEQPRPTLRAGAVEPLASAPRHEVTNPAQRPPTKSGAYLWWVSAIVCALAAVLLWSLLRSR